VKRRARVWSGRVVEISAARNLDALPGDPASASEEKEPPRPRKYRRKANAAERRQRRDLMTQFGIVTKPATAEIRRDRARRRTFAVIARSELLREISVVKHLNRALVRGVCRHTGYVNARGRRNVRSSPTIGDQTPATVGEEDEAI